MSMMPSAMESTPDMGPAPPDAQPLTLQDHLDAAIAIIGQDSMLGPDEMAAVSNFLQQVQMIGQAKAGGEPGQPPGGDPNAALVQQKMQQGGFGSSGPRDESAYGSPTSPNVGPYGG